MNLRDRARQKATHTSGGLVFSLPESAEDGYISFYDAFYGNGTWDDVPVLVERANGEWCLLKCVYSSNGPTHTLTGTYFYSPTGAALALDASEEVTVTLANSAMSFNSIAAKTLDPPYGAGIENQQGEHYPTVENDGLLAVGQKASASNSGVAIGQESQAAGPNNLAIGLRAFARQNSVLAIGQDAAAGEKSVALGDGIDAFEPYLHLFGNVDDWNNTPNCIAPGGYGIIFGINHDFGGGIIVSNGVQKQSLVCVQKTSDDTMKPLGLGLPKGFGVASADFYVDAGIGVFEGHITAVSTDGDVKVWHFKCVVHTTLNWGSTTIVGTPVLDVLHESAGAASWVVNLANNNGNNSLVLQITGAVGKNIVWNASIDSGCNSVWA